MKGTTQFAADPSLGDGSRGVIQNTREQATAQRDYRQPGGRGHQELHEIKLVQWWSPALGRQSPCQHRGWSPPAWGAAPRNGPGPWWAALWAQAGRALETKMADSLLAASAGSWLEPVGGDHPLCSGLLRSNLECHIHFGAPIIRK